MIDKALYRPIGQIDFVDLTNHPSLLFDPLRYQSGRASNVTLAATYTGSRPRSWRFQDLAAWMDDDGIKLIHIDQMMFRGNYRAIIGRK